jgi:hypothetical protein
MFGRGNDLIFFFAPLILALTIYGMVQNNLIVSGLLFAIVAGNGLGLNQLHLGPSWLFWLDKKNLEHWRSNQKLAFMYFVGPPLVLLLSAVLGMFFIGVVYVLTTLWGMQHFIQQNFGILALYHNRSSGEAVASRTLQSRSLWASSVFFCSFYFHKLVFNDNGGINFVILASVLLAVAVLYCVLYFLDIFKQVKAGAQLNVPALLFWIMGVLYFLPFAICKYDAQTAFLIPGVMHWVQYLFLNYMLVKYKYKDENAALLPGPSILVFVVVAVLIFIGSFSLYALKPTLSGPGLKFLVGFIFGISNMHYYQDAFLWRFREEFQRNSILPYLKEARVAENAPSIDKDKAGR